MNDCEVVGIDEAQFFDDEIIKYCNDLANRGAARYQSWISVVYKKPLRAYTPLMATRICYQGTCRLYTSGNLAQYSHRNSSDDGIVVLGEKETYEPLSRAAFYKENQKKQSQEKNKAQKKKL